MLRSRLPRVALPLRQFQAARSVHTLPTMAHLAKGIDGLYTEGGFDVAWTQYQGMMLEKVNILTAGSTDDHSVDMKALTLKYARQPSMASLFNHASMAHNNHFYFSTLNTEKKVMPSALQKELEDSFSSIETLRREIIATANAMFGPGYVWLVKKSDQRTYAILNTYLAGSPYAQAHFRRQSRDMNTAAAPTASGLDHGQQVLESSPIANTVGAHGASSSAQKLAPGAEKVIPVLCVSTWQHAYMYDWGVQNKKAFLEEWWNNVDWDVVAFNANARATAYLSS